MSAGLMGARRDRALDRALEAGEGEMRFGRAEQGPRKRDRLGVAVAGQRFDRRPAGIGQAEQFRGLVEGFAGGIVDRRRQAAIVADPAHFEQLAMPARHQQQQIREIEIGIGEARRQRMAFEMIDRDQRLARRQRQTLAGEQADHHPANQPRTGGRGDRIDLADVDAGFVQHLADQAGQDLDMGAGGDFGDNAAVRLVRRVLADHRLGENAPVAGHQRDRAVVARGFESEDQRHGTRPLPYAAPVTRGEGMDRPPILGTRGSPLALAQARQVAAAIEAAHGWPAGYVEIVPVRTSGDAIQDRPLAEIGGKALWTKELDLALLAGETDFSVHSMKDVESERPPAMHIAAVLERADVRDRLIGAESIEALARRCAGRDVVAAAGGAAAAAAARPQDRRRSAAMSKPGWPRSPRASSTRPCSPPPGWTGWVAARPASAIAVEMMLPAPAQAAIGIECRADDVMTRKLLSAIDHGPSHRAVMAERIFTRALGGTCHSPVAALAIEEGGELWLRGEILSEDGAERVSGEVRFASDDPAPPEALAHEMLAKAPAAIRRLFDDEAADHPAPRAGRERQRRRGRERLASMRFQCPCSGSSRWHGRRPIRPISMRCW